MPYQFHGTSIQFAIELAKILRRAFRSLLFMRHPIIGVLLLTAVARSMPAVAQVAQNSISLSPPDPLNAEAIPDMNPRTEPGDPDPSTSGSSPLEHDAKFMHGRIAIGAEFRECLACITPDWDRIRITRGQAARAQRFGDRKMRFDFEHDLAVGRRTVFDLTGQRVACRKGEFHGNRVILRKGIAHFL